MTLNEALQLADKIVPSLTLRPYPSAVITLAAEVRRLQSEVERLPARCAQPTVETTPIAPPNLAFFGIVDTDEEFSERAGRKVAEVAR